MDILNDVQQYVKKLFRDKLPETFTFHNLAHTIAVVDACSEIGKAVSLPDEEMGDLLLAAWFHDLGYLYTYQGHEEISQQVAMEYLIAHQFDKPKINKITRLIEKTKKDIKPETLAEKVLFDADHYHLAESGYLQVLARLRAEWEIHLNLCQCAKDWYKLNLNYLQHFRYLTLYGKTTLEKRKDENTRLLEMLLTTL